MKCISRQNQLQAITLRQLKQLSGGQKQRVAIARALSMEPETGSVGQGAELWLPWQCLAVLRGRSDRLQQSLKYLSCFSLSLSVRVTSRRERIGITDGNKLSSKEGVKRQHGTSEEVMA